MSKEHLIGLSVLSHVSYELGYLHDPGSLLEHIVTTVETEVIVGTNCYTTTGTETIVLTQQWGLRKLLADNNDL
jgi:hypothetical protein